MKDRAQWYFFLSPPMICRSLFFDNFYQHFLQHAKIDFWFSAARTALPHNILYSMLFKLLNKSIDDLSVNLELIKNIEFYICVY